MSDERLIVVATEDACGFDGEVSGHFGRCQFFLLAEANGKTVTVSEVVPNPYSGAHQRGSVPIFIHEIRADAIIVGGMGPKAIEMSTVSASTWPPEPPEPLRTCSRSTCVGNTEG